MGDGRWAVDGGRWTVVDGRCAVEGGQWTVWAVDSGRWTMRTSSTGGSVYIASDFHQESFDSGLSRTARLPSIRTDVWANLEERRPNEKALAGRDKCNSELKAYCKSATKSCLAQCSGQLANTV